MIFIERLLLNVFFVVFPLFGFPILIYMYEAYTKLKNTIICISSIITSVLCMIFSVPIGEGVILDFRDIPLLVGSLYGGPVVGTILFGFITSVRIIMGGQGIIPATIITLLYMIMSVAYSSKFQKLSSRFKVLTGMILSIIAWLIVVMYMEMNSGKIYIAKNELIIYFIIHTITMFLAIYLYEFFYEAIRLFKRKHQTEKLELVSHLSASISHEIRNPLTSVKGFLQLMLKDKNIDEDKKDMFLTLSINEIEHAEAIIRDYLTFAKPAPEKIEIFNIKDQLEYVINIIKPLANLNAVEINTSLIPCYIKGEKKLFHQCFINIFKNSIEAMNSGGTLEINGFVEKNKLYIVVSDNGIGMTEEQLQRIGEPYFTTKGSKGTGLGMLVVIKAIKDLNGKMHLSSKLNQGTTYEITFPVVAKHERVVDVI